MEPTPHHAARVLVLIILQFGLWTSVGHAAPPPSVAWDRIVRLLPATKRATVPSSSADALDAEGGEAQRSNADGLATMALTMSLDDDDARRSFALARKFYGEARSHAQQARDLSNDARPLEAERELALAYRANVRATGSIDRATAIATTRMQGLRDAAAGESGWKRIKSGLQPTATRGSGEFTTNVRIVPSATGGFATPPAEGTSVSHESTPDPAAPATSSVSSAGASGASGDSANALDVSSGTGVQGPLDHGDLLHELDSRLSVPAQGLDRVLEQSLNLETSLDRLHAKVRKFRSRNRIGLGGLALRGDVTGYAAYHVLFRRSRPIVRRSDRLDLARDRFPRPDPDLDNLPPGISRLSMELGATVDEVAFPASTGPRGRLAVIGIAYELNDKLRLSVGASTRAGDCEPYVGLTYSLAHLKLGQ